MRVIAGTARSVQLKTPEGLETRPTTDRIKETLFNMLQQKLSGSVFLDLFSGSGAIGIEALSRGADHSYFVENNREAIACIQFNLEHTKLKDKATILSMEVIQALRELEHKGIKFDIIFMDPPYRNEYEKQVLEFLENSTLIYEDTLILFEASLDTDVEYIENMNYKITKIKNYKTNKHIFVMPYKEQE